MTHKPISAVAVMYFMIAGPPSSPPTALLLRSRRMMIAIAASEQNSVTEKAKLWNKISLLNFTIFTKKQQKLFLTFQMALRKLFPAICDRKLPLSMQFQCPRKRWQHYCPSHYRHSHQHTCPEWLPLYLQTYLRKFTIEWNQTRIRLFSLTHLVYSFPKRRTQWQ